jgi:hypothetical protein
MFQPDPVSEDLFTPTPSMLAASEASIHNI